MEDKTRPCPTCETLLDDLGLCPRCLLAGALAPTAAGHSESMAPTLAEIAASFPDLEVIELIGEGGMGAVYKCRQKSLDRFVALKILPQTLAADESFALRFQAEAKALAALNHPNIVTIHDFGHQGGFNFLLMEFVDGLNLRDLIRDRKLSPEEALAIIPPLCEALQFAHERHIVHCDIKPENLLVDSNGRIKIADFGIATIIGQADLAGEKAAGTPAYMAPEQRSNALPVDARADIYSLGVVLYEMLTGERPDAALTPPSQKATLDVRFDEVVLRALQNQPEQRWQSATEFNTRLQTIVGSASTLQKDILHSGSARHRTPSRARISRFLAIFLTLALFGLLFAVSQYRQNSKRKPAEQDSVGQGLLHPASDADLLFLDEKFTSLYKARSDLFAKGLASKHPSSRAIYAQIDAYENQYRHLDARTLYELKLRVLRQMIAEHEARLAALNATGLGPQHPDRVSLQRRLNHLETFVTEIPPLGNPRNDE